jgi:hypothetical protein
MKCTVLYEPLGVILRLESRWCGKPVHFAKVPGGLNRICRACDPDVENTLFPSKSNAGVGGLGGRCRDREIEGW